MSNRTASSLIAFVSLSACGVFSTALADEISLTPTADATLYEDLFGDTAAGAGSGLFIGQNRSNTVYRTLLRFDLSAIPSDAVIESASLTVHCNRTLAGDEPATMHRVLADWGEGGSVPTGNGGAPAPAQTDDATWIFRFFVEPFGAGAPEWKNAGGDFAPDASASTMIGGEFQFFTFDGAGLASDVQSFVANPSANFGWLIRGREDDGSRSSKRLDSKESADASLHPTLTVVYSTAGGSCTDSDIAEPFGVLDLADVQAFVAGFLSLDPISDLAAPAGVFDLADLQAFIASFTAGCP